MTKTSQNILVAQIGAAHGVQGLVKLTSYTDPSDGVFNYKNLFDGAGNPVKLKLARPLKSGFLCRLNDANNRNLAESQKGLKLYIERAALKATDEDEFYLLDLIGLAVCRENGDVIGKITAVHNFGAGDLLEILPTKPPANGEDESPQQDSWYCPFTKAAVPLVDLKAGKIMINQDAAGLSTGPDSDQE